MFFPEIGIPPDHPFDYRIFHYKPSSYWGNPMNGKTPYVFFPEHLGENQQTSLVYHHFPHDIANLWVYAIFRQTHTVEYAGYMLGIFWLTFLGRFIAKNAELVVA